MLVLSYNLIGSERRMKKIEKETSPDFNLGFAAIYAYTDNNSKNGLI